MWKIILKYANAKTALNLERILLNYFNVYYAKNRRKSRNNSGANIINYGLFHVNYDAQSLHDKNYKLWHNPQIYVQ
jgi:hypothetical protein